MAVTYHEDGSSTKSIDERQTAKKNKNKNTKEPDYKSNDLKFGKVANQHVNQHDADAARRNK